MRILAIDPGIAKTGVALLEDNYLIKAETLDDKERRRVKAKYGFKESVVKKPKAENPTKDVAIRAEIFRRKIMQIYNESAINGKKPDVIVIEEFVDQGAARKQYAHRWKTPMLIGYLTAYFYDRNIPVVYQDNSDIRDESLIYLLKNKGILKDTTGDHAYDAALHGISYYFNRKG